MDFRVSRGGRSIGVTDGMKHFFPVCYATCVYQFVPILIVHLEMFRLKTPILLPRFLSLNSLGRFDSQELDVMKVKWLSYVSFILKRKDKPYNIYSNVKFDLAVLVSERRRESRLTVRFTFSNIGSPRSSIFCCLLTQPPILEALSSLPNIQWKTRKRRGHVIGYNINKIAFSKE